MNKQRYLGLFTNFVFVGLSSMMLSQSEAQIALDAVLNSCARKTLVYGRDGTRVGETIDGYCRGVLEGSFAILVHTGAICPKGQITTPEFLLSVVTTYRTESGSTDKDSAKVIEAAFKRAFQCRN